MSKIIRKINRWLWTEIISANGYYKLRIYQIPFGGFFWILRWGYWTAGFLQFFSLGKFYVRHSKHFKL